MSGEILVMDPAEKIPQRVHPEKKLCVETADTTQAVAVAVAVTKVLDDDNLLREIIVRVGFPTTLVRAALVCKRWLEHASDPKFLTRFRKLHPPRLLGYYITEGLVLKRRAGTPRFVPVLPQPTELATVIRRLESYNFGTHKMMDCVWNGRVFTKRHRGTKCTHVVHHPLCPAKGTQIIPQLPTALNTFLYDSLLKFTLLVSKEESSDLSYLYVLTGLSIGLVYMLQDGAWRKHTSATCLRDLHTGPEALLVHNKIYVLTTSGDNLIVFDLTALSFSTIHLPQGVKSHYPKSSMSLSRADDANSVYLIYVQEFQLCVWLHKGDNWLLVDTISLLEMLSTSGIFDHTLENEGIANVQIVQVGDNGQFVYLRMGRCIVYLDIKCRTMCKVYEKTVNDRSFGSIHPFMMIWPPTFPAFKEDPVRNAV